MSGYLCGFGFILCLLLQVSTCVRVFGWTWVHSVFVVTGQYLCPGIWVDLGSFCVCCYRSVLVSRHLGGFGFVLRGHHPVCVESVSPEGPAHKAGLQPGDQITAVNGVDVR